MSMKTFGAVVGLSAVLAAVPLGMLANKDGTTGMVPVAAAAPTTLYPGDPGYDDAKQWERDLPSYTPPATATHTVTVTPTTTKPAPATTSTKHEGGFPWWVWVLGTLGVIGGLLWWGTTLDDGSAARAALRTADDDDDDWDDDDDDAPVLTYPAITPVSTAEPIPYPETAPSVPAAPAPSGGSSLMDRLGK